jgi:8-oxo-dGTP pyrophosphatase MutT (NUDIX family)
MGATEGVTPEFAAATVVLLRDGADGIETLFARRNARGVFGGFWVFPGGRVDPADVSPSAPGDELEAARRAAVREAQEEVGLILSEASLVPLSHWTPPPSAPKRFLTWFFLAPLDEASTTVVIDEGEIVDSAWMSAQEAIRRRDAGEIEMAPPTWITLWRLAQFADVASALSWAADRVPERFVSVTAKSGGGAVLIEPGDAGWESGDAELTGARHRLHMDPAGWWYERDIAEPELRFS